MPKKMDRCVRSVMKQGKSRSSAYAMCQTSVGKKKKTKRRK